MKKTDLGEFRKISFELSEKLKCSKNEYEKSKDKLDNLKAQLNCNREFLYKYISLNSPFYNISELKTEINLLQKKVEELFYQKNKLENENIVLHEKLELKIEYENDKEKKLHQEINSISKRITDKEKIIENLDKEINKKIYNKNPVILNEIYVINPTKQYIELNTEMFYTKELTKKLNNLVIIEKEKIDELEIKENDIKKELQILKKSENKLYETKFIQLNEVEISRNSLYDYQKEAHDNFTVSEKNRNTNHVTNQNLIDFATLDGELESPNINFPDKVQMLVQEQVEKNKNQFTESILLPKLNLDKIKNIYQPISKYNHSQILYKQTKNPIIYNTNELNVSNVHIDTKLKHAKNELKISLNKISEYQNKLLKYQSLHRDKNFKILKINENLKLIDSKIDFLKNQINLYLNEVRL